VAVTTTMVITTLLLGVVERERWKWPLLATLAFSALFLSIDLAFWAANIVKIPHGGWFPLVIGAVVFTLMSTWKAGRRVLAENLQGRSLPIELFLDGVRRSPPQRVPGTAVFMYGSREGTPPALLHSIKHYQVLHETVVFLSVETQEVPHTEPEERVEVAELGEGFYRIVLSYGFMEEPNVPEALATVRFPGLELAPMRTSYFLGRETLIPTKRRKIAYWREQLFSLMARNARTATSFFGLPPNRVVELGAQIQL
jgi:KUP system potassium uptake protein